MFIQDTVSFITVNIFLVVNISENTGLDSGSQPGFFFFFATPPPFRDMCQYLEMFLVVTSWVKVLLEFTM